MPAATDFGPYAQWEFERRYLLGALPPPLDPERPVSRITDHYIDGTRFRVREQVALQRDSCVMKLGQKFPARDGELDRIVITNSYLNRAEYEMFLRLPGRRIVKLGWYHDYDGRRYVFDVFQDSLRGLILAEIEFESEEQMRAARPPPFPCVDVTNRLEFTGGYLAGRSFDDVRELVAQLTPPLG